MVTQMCVTTPGPWRSARTIVSPGIGRLLSSLEFQSSLLDDDRKAAKSLGSVRRNGSGRPGLMLCARAGTAMPSARAAMTTNERTVLMSFSSRPRRRQGVPVQNPIPEEAVVRSVQIAVHGIEVHRENAPGSGRKIQDRRKSLERVG